MLRVFGFETRPSPRVDTSAGGVVFASWIITCNALNASRSHAVASATTRVRPKTASRSNHVSAPAETRFVPTAPSTLSTTSVLVRGSSGSDASTAAGSRIRTGATSRIGHHRNRGTNSPFEHEHVHKPDRTTDCITITHRSWTINCPPANRHERRWLRLIVELQHPIG